MTGASVSKAGIGGDAERQLLQTKMGLIHESALDDRRSGCAPEARITAGAQPPLAVGESAARAH
jgi:hypothetical protein